MSLPLLVLLPCLVLSAMVSTAEGQPKVLELAAKNGCMKLMSLVNKAGLKHALDAADDVTLFAPSDAAIAAIPADVMTMLSNNVTLLQDVLKFHVVSQPKMAASLVNEGLLPTLSGNLKLRTNIYKKGQLITAQGSPVSKADLKASNGVVHVIDKVIFPLPTLTTPLFLTFDKDLNNLGFLAYQAKLIGDLSAQNLTVFAPSNEAIEKLPGQEYNNLLMNITELTDVLTYHVVKGTVFSAALDSDQMVPTLEGHKLHIQVQSGAVTVNGAKVTIADVSTSNGVVHVIDTLLFPPKPRQFDILIPILG